MDEQQVNLLDLDLCASFLEFGSDLLGLVLGDAFLEVLRSAIDEFLGFLQAQAGQSTDDLDDSDLVGASGLQDDIELSLLFLSGSSSATSACRGNRGVDVNLDDFMLSSVANDKKARMLLSYSGSCRNARGCIQENAKKQQPAALRALYPWAQLC